MKTIFVILAAVFGAFAGGLLVSFALYGRTDVSSLDTTLFGALLGAVLAGWLAARFGPEE